MKKGLWNTTQGLTPASAVLAWLHPLLQAGGLHLSAQLPADTRLVICY